MTITVTRSGGLLGNRRTAQVATERLPPDVAQRIEHAAAGLAAVTPAPAPPGAADYFRYDIAIGDGDEQRTIRFEGDPNPASGLINDVFAHAG